MKPEKLAYSSDRYHQSSYRYYALGLLTVVYTFNFIDRQLLAILQESNKLELGLSDASVQGKLMIYDNYEGHCVSRAEVPIIMEWLSYHLNLES